MANASSKKALKAQESTSSKYLPLIVLISVVFCVSHFTSAQFSFSILTKLLVYSVTHVITYFGIVEATKNKTSGEYYFDAFCVNIFSQFVHSFFSWGWYIWYIIPAYALYVAVSYYLSWRGSSSPSDSNGLAEDDHNRSGKEKKSRPKMKKIH